MFDLLAMVLAALAILFVSGAESVPCLSDPVGLSVTSEADIHELTQVFNCTGQGSFDVKWYSSVSLDQRIDIPIMTNVTITGYGLPTISGGLGVENRDGTSVFDRENGTPGLFSVSNGSTLRLKHLVLAGGEAGNGAAVRLYPSSTLFVFGCTFANNNASHGGAIYSYSSAIYISGNTSFEDNSALHGGAIYANASLVYIEDSTSFKQNSAKGEFRPEVWPHQLSTGGAVLATSSTVHIEGSTLFSNNTADNNGGAIYSVRSEVYMNGSTSFVNNSAVLNGGAMSTDESVVYMDGRTEFSSNSADRNAGAFYCLESEAYMNGSTLFVNNLSRRVGGAVNFVLSKIDMRANTSFLNNFAGLDGGAACCYDSNVYMYDSTSFVDNSADGSGGAVLWAYSDIYMVGTTSFVYNSAVADGGAVGCIGSEVHMLGSTSFVKNWAGETGGAVWSHDSEVYIAGSTLFGNNLANTSGGAVRFFDSEAYMADDTLFVNNSAGLEGGAVFSSGSHVDIYANTSFVDNSAVSSGGAFRCMDSNVSMANSTSFVNNSAGSDGGAVSYWRSQVFMNAGTVFVNNSAGSSGGALSCEDSEVYMSSSTYFLNWAGLNGGAVYCVRAEVHLNGSTWFVKNSAGLEGGAISSIRGRWTITGSLVRASDLTRNKGADGFDATLGPTPTRSIYFADNNAREVGGAISMERLDQLNITDVTFTANEAELGGAAYIAGVDENENYFSYCVFTGNSAEDGGALYLYTNNGVDTFTASVFRGNVARVSGGAIFHTGFLRVTDTSFMQNQAGIEGPAVMSPGSLQLLSNVSFVKNMYHCRAGEYGYIVTDETDTCDRCFDEVCSRCSSGGDAVIEKDGVRTDGYPVCAEPPRGTTASLSGTTVTTLSLRKGYYRTSNRSRVVLECFQEDACLGGDDTDTYCSPGYTGPYCAVCVDGYAPGLAFTCHQCSRKIARSAVGLMIALGLAGLLVAAQLFHYLGRMVSDASGHSTEDVAPSRVWRHKISSCSALLVNTLPWTAIKIVVTVWQIISQFDAIAGDVYPELLEKFVSKLTPVNLHTDFVLSYSCIFANDFYDHLIFATIAPLVTLVMLAGSYFVANMRNSTSESTIRAIMHKHQAVAIYVAFIVYSPVSYRIFQTFACDELDDGSTYLRADYSLCCSDPLHSWYEAYALIMVGVYPIGIPAVFAWLLGRHRKDLIKPGRDTLVHLKPLSGMWAAYRSSRYYFEVIECGRRIGLTVIATFVVPGSREQLAVALLFATGSVFISVVLSPFEKKEDMNLYRWGSGIVVASMYVAFLMKVDIAHEKTPAMLTFSGVIIAANVFMVITVLLETLLLKNAWRSARVVRQIDLPVRRTASLSAGKTASRTEQRLIGE